MWSPSSFPADDAAAWRRRVPWRPLAGALLLAAGLASGACMERPHYAGSFELPGDAGGRTLSVIGTGSTLLPPTHVDFECVLTTDADTPAESWIAAGNRMTRLMQALQDEGVPRTDLAPRAASLSTRQKGWRVTQHLRVGTDDLERLPHLLDVVMDAGGANDVTNLRPGHKNPRGAGDRARERALLNARDTAEMLAAELTLRVGDVLSIETLDAAAETAATAAPDEGVVRMPTGPADELEVVSRLRVTWRLEP